MSQSPHSPHLRIGQVVRLLIAEFPDVSISKLRFLEEQGLVMPERTQGHYRMYTDEHVRQLRQVLQMQRDEFLPLRVIRDELKRRIGVAATTSAGAGRPASRLGSGSERFSLLAPDELISEAELCERVQVTIAFVEECREADIVSGQRSADGQVMYSLQEASLVQAAGAMHSLGIDVRHLRQVRSAIGRQAALVEQYAAARLRAPNPEERAQAVRNVESLTQSLADFMRQAFVRDVRSMTARACTAGSVASGAGSESTPEGSGLLSSR